jgi:hypothetical protein
MPSRIADAARPVAWWPAVFTKVWFSPSVSVAVPSSLSPWAT